MVNTFPFLSLNTPKTRNLSHTQSHLSSNTLASASCPLCSSSAARAAATAAASPVTPARCASISCLAPRISTRALSKSEVSARSRSPHSVSCALSASSLARASCHGGLKGKIFWGDQALHLDQQGVFR